MKIIVRGATEIRLVDTLICNIRSISYPNLAGNARISRVSTLTSSVHPDILVPCRLLLATVTPALASYKFFLFIIDLLCTFVHDRTAWSTYIIFFFKRVVK